MGFKRKGGDLGINAKAQRRRGAKRKMGILIENSAKLICLNSAPWRLGVKNGAQRNLAAGVSSLDDYTICMNVVGTFSRGLAAALVLNLGVAAASATPASGSAAATAPAPAAAADNAHPYATIMARNVFGLVPIPPPPPPPAPPEDPPPKITANGIMDVFGQLQALFKVSLPGKGGQPAKDQSYMLSEGQRQDDIEVIKIDNKAATITFDNHGTTQEIPLETAKDSGGGPGPVTGGAAPGGGGFSPGLAPFHPRPGMSPGLPPGDAPAGNPFQPQSNNNGDNSNPASIPVANAGNGQLDVAAQAAQNTQGLTLEQQAVLIETERLANEDKIKNGSFPMLPPTPYTPPDTTGPTGEPIIQSPIAPNSPK